MKIFSFILTFIMSTSLYAQDDALKAYNIKRVNISKNGMIALSSWAGASIVTGGGLIPIKDHNLNYFGQMNIYWNLINLGIALPGIFRARKEKAKSYNLLETLEQQKNTEKLYLFNLGLDFGYIATGTLLAELSHRANNKTGRDILDGFGYAIIMQGGFLALFDLAMYVRHTKHAKKALRPLLKL